MHFLWMLEIWVHFFLQVIHRHSFARGFLLLFMPLHYRMVERVLSPDLTGELPWSVLMWELYLPPSIQQTCISCSARNFCSPDAVKLEITDLQLVGFFFFSVFFSFLFFSLLLTLLLFECRCSKTRLLHCQTPITSGLIVNPYGMPTACK